MKYLIIMLLSFGILSAEISEAEIPSTEYLIIDFYADWCGPCKQFGPVFDKVKTELSSKYRFEKMNIDKDGKELSKTYKVSSVPTILFFKKGAIVGREVGGMSESTFISKINKHFVSSS